MVDGGKDRDSIFLAKARGFAMLPTHGKIECRDCFIDNQPVCSPHPKWRLRNDPGAWGSREPDVLVLGFSKGSTQSNIYDTGSFEEVAFGGAARGRLDMILKKVGLIAPDTHVSDYISNEHQDRLAFGSLVR